MTLDSHTLLVIDLAICCAFGLAIVCGVIAELNHRNH